MELPKEKNPGLRTSLYMYYGMLLCIYMAPALIGMYLLDHLPKGALKETISNSFSVISFLLLFVLFPYLAKRAASIRYQQKTSVYMGMALLKAELMAYCSLLPWVGHFFVKQELPNQKQHEEHVKDLSSLE